MKERRTLIRTYVERNVQIIISDRMTPIDCTILDVTNKGAGLSVPATAGLPTTFAMSFDFWRSLRHCRLIWRSNKKIGVEFVP